MLCKRTADVALVRAAAPLGGEIVAVAVGAEGEVLSVLAGARTAGATRLVRLWDPGLETTDYLGVAYTLAAAIRAIGDPTSSPTVIVAGDRGRGVVGPAVAERLGMPLLGQVVSLALDGDKLVAKRRGRDVVRSYAAALPALVCMLADSDASTSHLDMASASDAGDVEQLDAVEGRAERGRAELSQAFRDQGSQGADAEAAQVRRRGALAAQLRAEGLVGGDGNPKAKS